MKKIYLMVSLMFLSVLTFSEGPLNSFKDPAIQQEFENVYQDIRSQHSQFIQNTSSPTTSTQVFSVSSATIVSLNTTSLSGMRNRLLNGDMRIDQQNEGTAIVLGNNANTYPVDMFFGFNRGLPAYWVMQRVASSPPPGFLNYLHLYISTSDAAPAANAEYVISTRIEGYNCQDFMMGTSQAKNITLSFWVRSSSAGIYGVNVESAGADSYPTRYTISAANAWEYKQITFPGNTSGTWNTTNGIGLKLIWDLGSGTDFQGTENAWTVGTEINHAAGFNQLVQVYGSTWDITGVQLELGSTATAFEFRPFEDELRRLKRYYEKSYPMGYAPGTDMGAPSSAATIQNVYIAAVTGAGSDGYIQFEVEKMDTPNQFFCYTSSGASVGVSGAMVWLSTTGINTMRAISVENLGSKGAGIYQTSAPDTYFKGHWFAGRRL